MRLIIALFCTALTMCDATAEPTIADGPVSWVQSGNANFSVGPEAAHGGGVGVQVADAKDGFAGWSQRFPVRADCTYSVRGWIKTKQANGARLRIVFTDSEKKPVGAAVDSPVVTGDAEWKEVATPAVKPPDGASVAELTIGLDGAGSASFDDLALDVKQVGGDPGNMGFAMDDAGWLVSQLDQPAVVDEAKATAQTAARNGWKIWSTPAAGRVGKPGIRFQMTSERLQECKGDWVNSGLVGGFAPPVSNGTPGAVWSGGTHRASKPGTPVVENGAYEVTWWMRGQSEKLNDTTPGDFHAYFDVNSAGPSYRARRGEPEEEGYVPYKLVFTTSVNTNRLWPTCGFGVGPKDLTKRPESDREGVTYTIDIAGYELRPAVEQVVHNSDFEDLAGRPKVVITAAQAKDLFSGRPARMLVNYPPDQPPGKGLAGPCFAIDLNSESVRMYQVVEHAIGGLIADPFLSADGKRMVYGSYPYAADGSLQSKPGEHSLYTAVVRERRSGNAADREDRVLIAERGYEPRWWRDPKSGEDYIIYVDTPASQAEDITGTTWIRQVERGGIKPVGPARKLIPDMAFRGGRSPDGRYICTTLPGFALAELKADALENAFSAMVFSGKRVCNGSISTDPAHPDRFTWIDPSHAQVFIQERDKMIQVVGNAPGYPNVQWSEWATAGDWLSASPASANDDATPSLHDAWVYRFSTKRWTQITKRAGTTHLWVGGDEAATPASPTATPATSSPTTKSVAPESTANNDSPLWAWADGKSSLTGRSPDGKPMYLGYSQPARLGAAYFDGDWSIRLDGGSFVDKRGGPTIATSLAKAPGLTLCAEITYRSGAGSILALGKDFVLAVASDGKLELTWMAGGKAQRAAMGKLTPDTPTHLVLTLSTNGPSLWRDGVAQPLEKLTSAWDASPWKADSLILGGDGGAGQGWNGELRALAIYDRVLDPSAIASTAAAIKDWRAKRPKVERVVISAKLKGISKIATPVNTAYARAYAWFLYEVTKGAGSLPVGAKIRVGRWVEMADRACLASQAQLEQTDELILEPYGAHPELEAEQAFDNIPNDPPEWWEVAPLAWATR
jgi:hypothetical protein